jgi:choline dehydrogenase
MHSGIGPAEQLMKYNIPIIANLAGVGQNLQDHLEYYLQFECKKKITLFSMTNPIQKAKTGIQWFLTKKGLAASSHLEAGGFISTDQNMAHPNLQYHFLPGLVNNHGRDFGLSHSFQVHVGTMRPESRGHLELVSNNPLTPLRIHANYLQTDNDWNELIASIPITRDIFNQPALHAYKGQELRPGINCRTVSERKEFIRENIETAYHPCGTCKMGTDEMSVVDPQAKVYGINNLRVVDASIMPSLISGNLNAPTIMIAERISEMILQN